MSHKDNLPGPAVSVTVTSTSTPTSTDQNSGDDAEMKQVWKFIYIDMTYVKSIPGIILASEFIISLLCIISVSIPNHEGCAQLYGSTYSYIEFTSSSCLVTCIIWYCLYLFAITRKIGFLRWDIGHMIWCAFYILNYFIASCVLAAHVCGQGGYKAGTAFGFICLIVLLVDGGLTFRGIYQRYQEQKSSRSGQQQQQPAEAAEVQY